MEKRFYTYIHTFPDGKGGIIPFHVGKGSDSTSARSHAFNRRSESHKDIVSKYGRKNIGVFVFYCDSEDEAYADEIHQIAQLRGEGFELCNKSSGGRGPTGTKHTDEDKLKRSLARMGYKHSPETISKMRESGRRRPPPSPDTREKISRTLKVYFSDPIIREAHRGACLKRVAAKKGGEL